MLDGGAREGRGRKPHANRATRDRAARDRRVRGLCFLWPCLVFGMRRRHARAQDGASRDLPRSWRAPGLAGPEIDGAVCPLSRALACAQSTRAARAGTPREKSPPLSSGPPLRRTRPTRNFSMPKSPRPTSPRLTAARTQTSRPGTYLSASWMAATPSRCQLGRVCSNSASNTAAACGAWHQAAAPLP